MTVFAHTAAMQHNVGSSVRVWRRELSLPSFITHFFIKWNTHVWEIIASFDFKRGISGNAEDFRPTRFQHVSFKRLVQGIALLRLPMYVDDQTTSKKSIRLYVTWYYVDINASHHRTLPLCWSCPNTLWLCCARLSPRTTNKHYSLPPKSEDDVHFFFKLWSPISPSLSPSFAFSFHRRTDHEWYQLWRWWTIWWALLECCSANAR